MPPSVTYLDHAGASFPKPDEVWHAARDFLPGLGPSPHAGLGPGAGRGVGSALGAGPGHGVDRLAGETRALIAELLGAAGPEQVVLTANASQALSSAIHGSLAPDDHVVTTNTEHTSVLRPLETLARAGVITYTVVDAGADGVLDLGAVRAAVRPRTRLLVANHASHVTGAIAPVAALAAIAHEAGARLLLDAAQSFGQVEIDVDALGVDLLAFTGHKALRGPSGIGGLYVREPDRLRPPSTPLSQWAGLSAGAADPGAVSHLAVAGLHAAARLLLSTGVATTQARTAALTGQCLRQLRALPGVTVYDLHPAVPRIPVVSLNVAGRYPSEVAAALDEGFGVLARAGMHSAPLMHRALGTAPHGTVRVSLGPTTMPGDLEVLREALAEISARVPVR